MNATALRIILTCLSLIDYVIAFFPAPDIAAQAEQMRVTLKQKSDALAASVKANKSS